MQWYNEPPHWSQQGSSIHVKIAAETDFWCTTHYGFIRDDGHFFYEERSGNFTADVKFMGHYQSLYDQAGLMVRIDEQNWLKCGVEYVDHVQQASVVVTRSYSDWSVVPLLQNPAAFWLRLERRAEAVKVSYSLDGDRHTMLRLAYLPPNHPIQIGLFCASPQGEGFEVTFEDLAITAI